MSSPSTPVRLRFLYHVIIVIINESLALQKKNGGQIIYHNYTVTTEDGQRESTSLTDLQNDWDADIWP